MTRLTPIVLALLLASPLFAAAPTTQRSLPYNEKADATRDIDAATERAKANNQRVLLDIGGNWCSWCLIMHDLFTNNEKVAAVLKANYQLVYVDAGHGDKNRDILVLYGLDVKQYPHLAILDTEGNLVTQQDTGIFETKTGHDPEKVIAFLEKWRAPKPAK